MNSSRNVLCLLAALVATLLPLMAAAYEEDALIRLGDFTVTADQWGLEAIGLDAEMRRTLATNSDRARVVVAVIDSGIDDGHPDFSVDTLWVNENEPVNGVDDDGNGFIDDRYGWDFIDGDNNPWDSLGHGTHVAGIIAAATGNGIGIAGVDGRARIMPLRALNPLGRGYSSRVAAAIYYAVANGAAIINLSMAVEALSEQERRAAMYASSEGVLVVAASGNEGNDAALYTPASIDGVLTVAASGRDNSRAGFSNYGASVDIAAPGVDIVSLRALNTHFIALLQDEAVSETALVGPKSNYYQATGTSFAAPFVSGAAALLKSLNPQLDGPALARILRNSATDIDVAGIDGNTGYGLLNVPAALKADPDAYVDCRIDGVQVLTKDGAPIIEVLGTAASDRLQEATLVLGAGAAPDKFSNTQFTVRSNIQGAALGQFEAVALAGSANWTLQLEVRRKGGMARQCRYELSIGG